jgi:hypothetical protein
MRLPNDDPELASRLSGLEAPQTPDPLDTALDLDYARFRLLEASRGLQEAISQTVAAIIVAQIDIDRWIAELEKK